jgi:hypothetical protein
MKTREHFIFRSGHLENLTDKGIESLQRLGINMIFDLRSPDEADMCRALCQSPSREHPKPVTGETSLPLPKVLVTSMTGRKFTLPRAMERYDSSEPELLEVRDCLLPSLRYTLTRIEEYCGGLFQVGDI